MGILDRLFGRTRPIDVIGMPTDPDGFLAALGRRKFWRRIDGSVLAAIAGNANGNMELLRNFVFVSEMYRLVENNFLALAANVDSYFGSPASGFAFTLYRLGSDLCTHVISVSDPDEQESMLTSADMAFTSAVLCDPLQLEAYVGMVHLYTEILFNKEAGLEWCEKYKIAEQRLLRTPDEHLSGVHLMEKQAFHDPDEAKRALLEMAEHAPELLDGFLHGRPLDEVLHEDRSMREMIEDIERRLLSS